MFPDPVKVKNISVYPFTSDHSGGPEPVVAPVIENASGTYSIGTLFTNVFYNLNLEGGKENSPLVVHEGYVAVGEMEDGTPFTSNWMYCLTTGGNPAFGLTLPSYYAPHHYVPGSTATPPYFPIAPLTDIIVSQLLPPPAIGQHLLIANGAGNLIATKVGAPHEMGVEVISGERLGTLADGLQYIIITGKNGDGNLITIGSLTCTSAEEPAVFLRQLV